MQKRNERKNVVLLGFLKDFEVMGGNDPSLQCYAGQAAFAGFGAAWALESGMG
jgi:hypothetical protein